MTTVFLDLSFAAERWLRHKGRLAKNTGMAEKILSGFSSELLYGIIQCWAYIDCDQLLSQ